MQLLVDSTPVIHQPRKIPVAIRNRLEKLEEIENTGIIKKVYDPSEQVDSFVIVVKPDRILRLCLDARDLSKVVKREQFQLPTF